MVFHDDAARRKVAVQFVVQRVVAEADGGCLGTAVGEGDTIVIVESMKMEIPIAATCTGVVREILVAEGDPVTEDQAVAVVG